jgi:hypothetical protein
MRALRVPLACAPSSRAKTRVATAVVAFLSLPIALAGPSAAHAAVTTFGSPLSVPATLNTAENLGYQGTNTPVYPSPEAPNGIYHTYHYGADTALWNAAEAAGAPQAPESGQAVSVRLEGCAEPAAGGPAPLTQIHFQDLTPLPGGGAKVNLSSQPFEIPVCGQNGASGSTVSTYEPTNLCVAKGDYVAFNDEGGFVEHSYQSGVPYEVIGAVAGSTMDSFIRGGGTGNGASFSPTETSAMEGFAANAGEELMLQVTLGTGANAAQVCGGAPSPPPAAPSSPAPAAALPPIKLSRQTDGVNHARIVAVAVYCHEQPDCKGLATLTLDGRRVSTSRVPFTLPADATSHVPIRLVPKLLKLIRKHHGIPATVAVVVDGQTFTQTIEIKIL